MFIRHLQNFIHGAARLAPCHLDARLFANAHVAFARAVIGPVRNRNRIPCEGCDRCGIPDAKLLALQPANTCDKGQVVIVAPLPVAFLLPPADLAVRGWFGRRRNFLRPSTSRLLWLREPLG